MHLGLGLATEMLMLEIVRMRGFEATLCSCLEYEIKRASERFGTDVLPGSLENLKKKHKHRDCTCFQRTEEKTEDPR
jgi:hypothetical protein